MYVEQIKRELRIAVEQAVEEMRKATGVEVYAVNVRFVESQTLTGDRRYAVASVDFDLTA